MIYRCFIILSALFAHPLAAAAGSLDRLQAVSTHARDQAASGPSHLWVGIILGVGFLGVISMAAIWTAKKKTREKAAA